MIFIKYIFEHKTDKDTQEEIFTIEQIENGEAKEFIDAMKVDGYRLIDRIVETDSK
jgi:hypothetical protein